MNLNQSVKECLKEMLHTPDGVTALVLSMLFLLFGLAPNALNILGSTYGFLLKGGTSVQFLLIPPMLFVALIWLNAFTKTSKIGAYFNAILLIIFAFLIFKNSIKFM